MHCGCDDSGGTDDDGFGGNVEWGSESEPSLKVHSRRPFRRGLPLGGVLGRPAVEPLHSRRRVYLALMSFVSWMRFLQGGSVAT